MTGVQTCALPIWSAGVKDEEISNKIEQFLSPELLNRVDDVVVFRPFADDEFESLASLYIDEVIYRASVSEQCFVTLENKNDAASFIVSKMSVKEKMMGARAVKRAVGRYFESPLLEKCYLNKDHETSISLEASVKPDGFAFS